MSLVIIGMSAAFAVAGGALGFAGGLITGIGQAFSRMGSSRISLTKYTLTGALAGLTITCANAVSRPSSMPASGKWTTGKPWPLAATKRGNLSA